MAERGEEVVFFDGRNAFEARIGKFKNAIVPMVGTTPDFVQELESGKYDHLKNKPIVTYCTGGIRCEKSTSLLVSKGFDDVWHLKGGILNYLEETPESSTRWEGECFVFDNRVAVNHQLEKGQYDQCFACWVL